MLTQGVPEHVLCDNEPEMVRSGSARVDSATQHQDPIGGFTAAGWSWSTLPFQVRLQHPPGLIAASATQPFSGRPLRILPRDGSPVYYSSQSGCSAAITRVVADPAETAAPWPSLKASLPRRVRFIRWLCGLVLPDCLAREPPWVSYCSLWARWLPSSYQVWQPLPRPKSRLTRTLLPLWILRPRWGATKNGLRERA